MKNKKNKIQLKNQIKPSNRNKLLLRVFLAFFAIGTIQGCSVFQYVDLSIYPVESRTIYIRNLLNNTFEPDVHVFLTRAIREEIQRRDNFILRDNQSEAKFTLAGEITVYRKEGRLYDNYRNPTRYELIVYGVVVVRETGGDGNSSTPVFSREISARVDFSVSEGYVETERDALERLSTIFARKAATAIEMEFISRYPPPEKG